MKEKKGLRDGWNTVLLTGGAGYIGSHIAIELLENKFRVIIVDNFSNSSSICLDRIRRIANVDKEQLIFFKRDIVHEFALRELFEQYSVDAIIHLAGYKAVGESVQDPLKYYFNNLTGTINLCREAKEFGVKNLLLSSSATVYGNPSKIPVTELDPIGIVSNPYGHTKVMSEQILRDLWRSDNEWNIVFLRYFNPIGAHHSGLLGEDPRGVPNNLVPSIAKVAIGEYEKVKIYGNDYHTHDGTGVRDYIHVVDLARGHFSAIRWMENRRHTFFDPTTSSNQMSQQNSSNGYEGVEIFNLGTGRGYSVLDVIKTYEQASKRDIPYKFENRREGDIAEIYASSEKAKEVLNWQAEYDLYQMCLDSWNWQFKNPNGYGID